MRYVRREMEEQVLRSVKAFPAVVLTGPRRAGKTCLLRHLFPKADYFLLEDPDVVARLRADPQGFLDAVKTPAILDEVQNVPEVFAFIRRLRDWRSRRQGVPGSGLYLGKQLLDNTHGQEQPGRVILEKRELVAPVKRNGRLALRIDDDCERGNLARRLQTAVKGIHQKILSCALPLQPHVDSQASKNRCRNDWVLGKFLRHVLRPRANIDADGRKRVVTENRGAIAFAQHKWSGNALARVLPRLCSKVSIERLAAAGKL
ncbi:MAG: hypothetical protein A2V83_03470 [Nitrospirae bacterium RBG_16_64_22]|nr:MAG: hypothetical protein A2V83_03470 [Nitrospirae bacterium RBG_16_64_22]